ncbi:MAG: PKD domain-containing protein, partial [Flavobacteriales bacterium]
PVTIPYSNTYSTSFTPAGQHTIQYIVETEYGCLDTTEIDTVDVVDVPICGFDVIDTLCVNDSSIYVNTNLSTGHILTYQWEIFDSTGTQLVWNSGWIPWINGGVNIPAFPSLFQSFADTSYVISLSVGNCCDTVTCTDTIIIQPLPIIGLGIAIYPAPCPPNTIPYIATGNSISINLNSYINTINTDTITIHWGDTNLQGILIDTILPNPSQPYWITATHLYPDTGHFTIIITAINNCGSTDTTLELQVVENTLWSEFIPPPPGCVGDTFRFEETSYNHPNTQVFWCFDWDPSTIPWTCNINNNPLWIPYVLNGITNYVYQDPGEYLVYHEYRDMGAVCDSGFSDTTVYTVVVHPNPNAVIDSCKNICQNIESTWTHSSSWIDSLSTPNYPQINTGQTWYIYDNLNNPPVYTASTSTLTYTFSQAGNYTIILEVTSNNLCVGYDTCVLEVYSLPTANLVIMPDSSCLGYGLTIFDANSSINGTGGQINYWEFTFGSPQANPPNACCQSPLSSTTFIWNGNWLVDLIVEDQSGCRDTITDTVIINNGMTAYFEADTVCEGVATSFTSSQGLSSPNANAWLWNFGDGIGTSNIQDPTYTYNAAGDYHVTLTLSDNNYIDSTHCMDTVSFWIHVYELPIPNFTTDTACFGDSTHFTSLSTIGEINSTLISWWWYFDNDTLIDATSINPNYLFNSCGLNFHDIILRVEDNNGCYNYDTNSITVACLPTATFTIDTACIGHPTIFTSTSNNGTFPITSYQWINSQGTYQPINDSTLYYATYIFNNIGTQNPTTLIVSDPLGCSDDSIGYAYVRENPVANWYTIDTNYCANTPIQFFNNTTTQGIMDSISWTFQTGITSNGTNTISQVEDPIVVFPAPGNWSVELFFADEFGCYDDTISLISIDSLPIIN